VRLIIEMFGRAAVFQFNQGRVTVHEDDGEEFEHAPVDPHSVGGCMVEHADQNSVEVQQFSGAGVYQTPEDKKRGMGFGR
jgi:hypothetical protein